ncbi:hypothetical protein N7533_010405, partial [Penicillium manginii]|uniref:uncharacterized protein n=1 Tax=Penicillium manginii TaxID=203109 RepID=UPI002548A25D
YIDSSLIGSGKFDEAAISSVTDGQLWAGSSGFSLKVDEIQSLIDGFGNPDPLYSNGLHVAGQKYLVTKADDRSIYGKKGKEGVCAVKTKQAVIVAHYSKLVLPGEAARVVESLADYLIGQGY